MSQIGLEDSFPSAATANSTYTAENGLLDVVLAGLVLSIAVVAVLGNLIMLMLIIVIPKLQKPQNAFFLHQMILDFMKGILCVLFSKVLLTGGTCSTVGALYVHLITCSVLNMLTLTVNEIYHFTNRVVDVKFNNVCCIGFGVIMLWLCSSIINLGIIFLPAKTPLSSEPGYCLLIYGMTRNFPLHVLWISIISAVIILNSVYLAKLRKDIRTKAYHRMSALLNNEGLSPSPSSMTCDQIARVIETGERNLKILISQTALFVICWYPFFILSLVDYRLKVTGEVYRWLTAFGWFQPCLTPLLFILYNNNYVSVKTLRNSQSNPASSFTPANREFSMLRFPRVSKPSSIDVMTPMTYLSTELSYNLFYDLTDGEVSPSIISHLIELRDMKLSRRRRMKSSTTCPENLLAAKESTKLDSIQESTSANTSNSNILDANPTDPIPQTNLPAMSTIKLSGSCLTNFGKTRISQSLTDLSSAQRRSWSLHDVSEDWV